MILSEAPSQGVFTIFCAWIFLCVLERVAPSRKLLGPTHRGAVRRRFILAGAWKPLAPAEHEKRSEPDVPNFPPSGATFTNLSSAQGALWHRGAARKHAVEQPLGGE